MTRKIINRVLSLVLAMGLMAMPILSGSYAAAGAGYGDDGTTGAGYGYAGEVNALLSGMVASEGDDAESNAAKSGAPGGMGSESGGLGASESAEPGGNAPDTRANAEAVQSGSVLSTAADTSDSSGGDNGSSGDSVGGNGGDDEVGGSGDNGSSGDSGGGNGGGGGGNVLSAEADGDGGGDAVPPKPPEDEVYAKTVGARQFKLSVDIQWGAMKFVYDFGGGEWDPATHTYKGGSGSPGWLVDNASENGGTATEWYLEQGNNRILVTNHSNDAVEAVFSYSMLTGVDAGNGPAANATPFNADGTGRDSVAGGFYGSEESAKAGALILANPKGNAGFNTLPGGAITLPSAEGRGIDSPVLTRGVFFAFSGAPDVGRVNALPDFRKVGAITVSISKKDVIIVN